MEQLLTVSQAASILQIHPKSLYRLVESKRIPCVRVASRIRFRPKDLERWIGGK